MGLTVRKAEVRDVPQIFKMNEMFNEPGCTTVSQMTEELLSNSQETVCVAELDGELVGFGCGQMVRSVCYSAPHGEITELFVREEFLRMGVGKALMLYLEAHFTQRDVNDFKLYANPKNFAAQMLYMECGYSYDLKFSFWKFVK